MNGHTQPSKCIAPECYFASSNSDVICGKILCSLFTFESYFDEFIASRHNSICCSKFNCSKQWRTSSYLYQIFSTCLVDKKYTLDPSSWVQNQGLVCKAGFSAAPLLCSGLVVYLLSVNQVQVVTFLFAAVVGYFLL